MRRFREGRVGVAVVAVAAAAAIGIALAASQAQGRDAEQTTFQLRADIVSRFVATYAAELLHKEQVAATAQLSGTPPDLVAFAAVNDAFGFPAVVLLDANGDALAVDPPTPGLIGKNLSGRYSHLATATDGHQAVSNLALSAALGRPVVAFATPFTTPAGQRVYSGAYEVAATPLAEYLVSAIPYGARAYLIDAKGDIVTSTAKLDETAIHLLAAEDSGLAKAIASGPQGTFQEGAPTYFAMRAVAGTPWRVAVSVPTATLYAALSGPALWVPWVLFALFVLGLVVALVLFLRYMVSKDRLAGLNVELDRVARIDSLTGLHNRRHMDEQILTLLSAARRHETPVGFVLIDVDHFKRVNDTAGHAAGDRVLEETARRLRTLVRAEDVIGRWGGEEFLVLMPGTAASAATRTADRLCASMAATPIDLGRTSFTVTVSIGVSSGTTPSADDLLNAADQALYQAKREGRNRAVNGGEVAIVALDADRVTSGAPSRH